jgi:competence protein ComEA
MTFRSISHLSIAGLAITGAMLLTAAHGASAQAQLPDGAGKDAVVRMCGTCHPVERAASVRLTREGWQDTIAKMMTLGAKGSDEDTKAVLEYLSTHYKGEAGKPLNLNTATSIDLESITMFLRKESAAWIAWRAKNGPCKTVDDLKKVPGVDFKKIEERRERLVCF